MNPLTSAQAELETLVKLQAEIGRKIEAVKKSIGILEPLYANERDPSRLLHLNVMMTGLENLGITEAVQWALSTRPEGLAPTQVRDLLVEHGYSVRGENPMATVHTVLKRLAGRTDGLVVAEAHAGKTLYKSVAPAAAASQKGKAQFRGRVICEARPKKRRTAPRNDAI